MVWRVGRIISLGPGDEGMEIGGRNRPRNRMREEI